MKSVIALIAMTLCIAACDGRQESTADAKQAEATQQLMAEAERQIGMPAIKNFQERKLMKMIMELRDKEDLTTYAYLWNEYNGKLVFIGKCVGFGLPYSVQFTNPEVIVDYNGKHMDFDFGPMPQPDPNGLFMPDGLSATWLMMLDEETGEVRPVYVEPQIIVSPFPLHSSDG